MILEFLQYSLVIVIGIILIYQIVLSLFALRGKRIENFDLPKNRKFAILFLANSNEKGVAKSLYSLSGLVYPKSLYDLIVVTNNGNDSSAKLAYNLGAIVLNKSNWQNENTSDIIKWAFRKIQQRKVNYNAIALFDASSLVSGNYLEVMNYYLANGSEIIQGSNLILSEPEAWNQEAKCFEFLLNNHVKPLGRKILGLPTFLQGNGICFSTKIFEKLSLQDWRSAKEMEYSLILNHQEVEMDFAPEAHISHVSLKNDDKKRLQLAVNESRYSMVKKHAFSLLRAAWKNKSFEYVDRLIELVTPSLFYTLSFSIFLTVINSILWLMGWLSLNFVLLWGGITVLGVLYLLIGLTLSDVEDKIRKSIFYIPTYLAWKTKRRMNLLLSKEKENRWASTEEKNSDVLSGGS